MTKIGILSDTHLTGVSKNFIDKTKELFHDVDMLFHAGDTTSLQVHEFLSNWDLRAVRGNMDDFDLSTILPEKRIEEIEGRRIGIIHGRGGPHNTADFALSQFRDVQIIVFGHTHVPLLRDEGGVILFNPGAFRGAYQQGGTVGLLEIGETIRFQHIEIR